MPSGIKSRKEAAPMRGLFSVFIIASADMQPGMQYAIDQNIKRA